MGTMIMPGALNWDGGPRCTAVATIERARRLEILRVDEAIWAERRDVILRAEPKSFVELTIGLLSAGDDVLRFSPRCEPLVRRPLDVMMISQYERPYLVFALTLFQHGMAERWEMPVPVTQAIYRAMSTLRAAGQLVIAEPDWPHGPRAQCVWTQIRPEMLAAAHSVCGTLLGKTAGKRVLQ